MTALLLLSLGLHGPASQAGSAGFVSVEDLDVHAAWARRAIKSCGPVAVCYGLRRSGRDVTLAEVLSRSDLTDEGIRASELLDLLAAFGSPAEAVAAAKSDLELVPAPAIFLITPAHCVVYEGLEDGGQTVRYLEPSDGSIRQVPRAVMLRDWTGEVILMRKPDLPWGAFLGWAVLSALFVFSLVTGLSRLAKAGKPGTGPGEATP